jgi:nitroreductase
MEHYDPIRNRSTPGVDFYDVLLTRRSVRSYANRSVDDETVIRVLDAARIAPSASNTQPWHFVVIREVARRQKLAELAAGQMFIAEAPIVIAACGQAYHDRYSWITDNMFLIDVAIALDHLTLAARTEGLGTCWVGAFDHDGVHQLLKVPDTYRVVMLTPLGYPANKDAFGPPGKRKNLSDIVSNEEFRGT